MRNPRFVTLSLLIVTVACDQNLSINSIAEKNIKDIFNTVEKTTEHPISNNVEKGKYKSCGTNKECVPRILCNDGSINTNGKTLITIKFGSECHYLETCCSVTDRQTTSFEFPDETTNKGSCGYSNPEGVTMRISGAENRETEFGEFPWMVAITRKEKVRGSEEVRITYACGGSLISPWVILTAGHCVRLRNANELTVVAGEWDTETTDEFVPHQVRSVDEIVLHENYNKGTLYNDVALMILAKPFDLTGTIQPICLPDVNAKFDNLRCIATGWGKDKQGSAGRYQKILKKIELPIVPVDRCQDNLRERRRQKHFQLHESFICAGGELGKDTCDGDGGSPLVCLIDGTLDRYVQAGIVAWGNGCGEENVPGVYANVAYLRPWISEKLAARNLNQSFFQAN